MIAASSWSIETTFRRQIPRTARALALAGIALGAMAVDARPALADLRLCNMTGSRVGVVIGHRGGEGWITEGWFNIVPRTCETLLEGALASRFYYVYAIDYDRGGEWGGRTPMCTREREFIIRGIEDCLSRGFDRNGFLEVDTGQQRSWTIQLTDPGRTGAAQP